MRSSVKEDVILAKENCLSVRQEEKAKYLTAEYRKAKSPGRSQWKTLKTREFFSTGLKINGRIAKKISWEVRKFSFDFISWLLD